MITLSTSVRISWYFSVPFGTLSLVPKMVVALIFVMILVKREQIRTCRSKSNCHELRR